MGLINNIYVQAKESLETSVETTSHPTESGMPVSDSIRKQPIVLNLNGKIVDTDKLTAQEAIAKLKKLEQSGSLITYIGAVGKIRNLQIQSFNEDYDNKTHGGANFDMTLKELKIAKSAYVKPKAVTSTKKKITVGDTVKFAGGAVYVASDAKKASAVRGSSICKLTKISTLRNATHLYHLISKDGGRVYGWVDTSLVSAISTTVSSSSSGGSQQVQGEKKSEIYHIVGYGETLVSIVNRYKGQYNFSCDKIKKDNPSAFSSKTGRLLAGKRLKLVEV